MPVGRVICSCQFGGLWCLWRNVWNRCQRQHVCVVELQLRSNITGPILYNDVAFLYLHFVLASLW